MNTHKCTHYTVLLSQVYDSHLLSTWSLRWLSCSLYLETNLALNICYIKCETGKIKSIDSFIQVVFIFIKFWLLYEVEAKTTWSWEVLRQLLLQLKKCRGEVLNQNTTSIVECAIILVIIYKMTREKKKRFSYLVGQSVIQIILWLVYYINNVN